MILVDLATATICFLNQCYPALVGPETPTGEFRLEQVRTEAAGYGGDVILFKETKNSVFAIHRVWLLNPKQQRIQRLTSGDVTERIAVTLGCINVMPDVYDKLVDCCNNQLMVISR
jgi:hypothetical protein